MRILLVAHALPADTYGGTELYTERLAEAFAADHEVAVAVPADRGGTAADVEGASVVGLPTPTTQPEDGVALDPAAGVAQPPVDDAFADLLATLDPDVVHFQHLKGLSAGLPRRCADAGVPSVLTLHDFWTICHREQLTRPDGTLCSGPTCVGKCTDCYADAVGAAVADAEGERERGAAESERVDDRDPPPGTGGGETGDDRLPGTDSAAAAFPAFAGPVARRTARLDDALDAVDRLVSPSAFLRDQFVRFGVDPADVVHARNGIRVDAFRDGGFDPDGTLAFGYAGRLVEEKGVHLLIEAFAEIEADASLDVYGQFSPETDDYHARLAGLARDRVTFHGAYDDPADPFAAFDVFVLPSTWYENSPLVIQEAFAAGTPVVTADRGGMAELVADGVDGLTFDPESVADLRAHLRWLASRPDRVARLREGVDPPKRLSTHADDLLALYAGVAGGAATAGSGDDGRRVEVSDP